MKFKKGDKVIPISKSTWGSLDDCGIWSQAKYKQGYLYITGYMDEEDAYLLDSKIKIEPDGNFYKESDLIRYEETKEESKQDTYTMNLSSYTYTNRIYHNGKHLITDVENVEKETIRFIRNNNAVIVILEDGSKGVAKCMDGDEFNLDKGYNIAIRRAHVKKLQRDLKKLTK